MVLTLSVADNISFYRKLIQDSEQLEHFMVIEELPNQQQHKNNHTDNTENDNDNQHTSTQTSNKIVCIASAEITPSQRCAELTDCATLPEYRGRYLSSSILS